MLKLMAIGHIGKDAVLKEVNGKKVINFSIAHTEKYRNAQGTEVEKTTWIECAMWEKEKIAPYLLKGTQVYVEGTPDTNAYVVEGTGELRSTLKLAVFNLRLLSSKKDGSNNSQPEPAPTQGGKDDLPF